MLHRAEGRRRGFFERGRPNGMCTAKRDVVMYGVVYPVACISVDVVCIPWLSYCEYCFIASATHRVHRHRKSLDITDRTNTPGAGPRRTARVCATRWRYSVQTGRAPSQPPEAGGPLHKRDLAVPSPASSVTPLHRSCTQGKARQWGTPDMGTTRRTGMHTSPDGVRDERESRGGSR